MQVRSKYSRIRHFAMGSSLRIFGRCTVPMGKTGRFQRPMAASNPGWLETLQEVQVLLQRTNDQQKSKPHGRPPVAEAAKALLARGLRLKMRETPSLVRGWMHESGAVAITRAS